MSLAVIPPIFGAISPTTAPSASAAATSTASVWASVPSVTRIPSLRPAKVATVFCKMLRAGDGARSVIGDRAGVDAGGRSARPSPSATIAANSSSTLRKLATMRTRMSMRSTFESSNTNELTMCVCSTGVWLAKNRRAWL